MWSAFPRPRFRRLSLTGSKPCRARFRCVVCVRTSSLSSLVVDAFETLTCWMRGLSSHVIAVISWFCPVFIPVFTTIAVGNVYTDCPRIGPAIARNVWSVLARHRYRPLSLTASTRCCARARCVVCISTPSLSSLVIDGFDTMPRSRAMCGQRLHVIAIAA